jgi:hypothetical protein
MPRLPPVMITTLSVKSAPKEKPDEIPLDQHLASAQASK